MSIKRRDFLMFLGAGAGTILFDAIPKTNSTNTFSMPFMETVPSGETFAATDSKLSFKPVQGPMPLKTIGISKAQQITSHKTFDIVDDLVLPEGFTYDVVAAWGDKVGDSRFGYNNDYLSLVETGENEGYLTVNFEYISAIPWEQSFKKVIGKSLPFDEVNKALKTAGEERVRACLRS